MKENAHQVAKKMPRTLQELMQMSPDDLIAYSLEELNQLHTLSKQGTTKAAMNLATLLETRIANKKKEAAKDSKREPVANSAKTADKPKTRQTAAPKASPTPKAKAGATTPKKEEEKPAADVTPKPKKQRVVKTPVTEPKGQKAASTAKGASATKKRGEAKEKPSAKPKAAPETSSTYEEIYEAGDSIFRRVDISTVQELGEALVDNPYSVYLFMDEEQPDYTDLTQFLLVYSSEASIIAVDKSRKIDTYMHLDGEMLRRGAYIFEEKQREFAFPFAIYVRENK